MIRTIYNIYVNFKSVFTYQMFHHDQPNERRLSGFQLLLKDEKYQAYNMFYKVRYDYLFVLSIYMSFFCLIDCVVFDVALAKLGYVMAVLI